MHITAPTFPVFIVFALADVECWNMKIITIITKLVLWNEYEARINAPSYFFPK